jgi:rhodanese-related sulfurtransferase
MITIDVETLRNWLEEGRSITVLDVRPTTERAEWAIPGSIHVDAYDALKANDPKALAEPVTDLEAGANRCAIS